MNANDFEKAVRELRYRQRRFFGCRKDSPDRPKALQLMREQEAVVHKEVDHVMRLRPKNKRVENEREEFFLAVADMMAKQREWARQGGGSWQMNPAREAERTVDRWLAKFDDQHKEEERRKQEELMKRQTKLF